MSADPWTPEWLEEKGIDPAVWEARGCRRYERGDPSIKEEFREFLPSSRWGTVTRIVNQSAGWYMPKHPPPGFPPIPSQLRPDKPVITDPQTTWQYHGPELDGVSSWKDVRKIFGEDGRPVYPPEAGPKLAGRPLPMKREEPDGTWVFTGCLLWGAAAESHVNAVPKDGEGDYDPVTGLGAHNGVPVDFVHKHAPSAAKYLMLGKSSRIDMHPVALERLPQAKVVFLVMEGTPKTDSILSTGACAIGIPSVTCWDDREFHRFAGDFLPGKTVLVVPDADWSVNWQVERQALKIRTLLRRRRKGIEAHVCAPPTKDETGPDNYCKGPDDHLAVKPPDGWDPDAWRRYRLGELVIDGRELPFQRIKEAVQGLPHQRRKGAERTLENLSLYVDRKTHELKPTFQTLKGLLGIRDADRIVEHLEWISHCFTIMSGSLETKVEKTRYGRKQEETVWTDRPKIRLNEEYRANQRRSKLLVEDFWQREAQLMHGVAIQGIRDDIDELKRWRRDQESHDSQS
jgi:hypothetical protein